MTPALKNVDCVFVIHLRSYGFFHSGRERLVVQVLKRTWNHVPGSTLYGAVAAALLRLDSPLDGEEDLKNKLLDANGEGQYFDLLRAVKAQQIRFTPLLPSTLEVRSGEAYCQQAMRLMARRPVDNDQEQVTPSLKAARQLFHTTPHAPLSRGTEKIHGDQLFAIRTHRPQLDYYGFIFGKTEHKTWLEKALRFFPFLPVGGKGKFSSIEGEILAEQRLDSFRDALQQWAAGRNGWINLLTPMVMPMPGLAEPLDIQQSDEVIMTGLQRYRVWRTGLYFNGEGDFDEPAGIGPYYSADDSPLHAGGAESVAVQAVPERSRFRLKDIKEATRWFIEGTGHPGWSYLGWGQVVIE